MARDRRQVQVRRVYEDQRPDDGVRVLVDRIWPRGLGKEAAKLDLWAKDVAPSAELRTWFGHDPEKFPLFSSRYREELGTPAGHAAFDRLLTLSDESSLTLLTATRDVAHSHAAVLAELLRTAPEPDADADADIDAGGDPACWLSRVCPECGLFAEQRSPTTCARCGAELPAG